MKIKSNSQTYSSKYHFLQSNFDWLNQDNKNDFSIQSLVVSGPFFNLKEDLLILDDLKKDYKDLGFELLVQRDIDKERVETEIVENYLSVEGKTNFFPPLVVALIPAYKTLINEERTFSTNPLRDEDGNLELKIGDNSISQTFILDSEFSEDFSEFFNSKELKYGHISWDREKTNAIIIDGQHRFHALKKYLEKGNNFELSQCFFPINFVVITPEFQKEMSVNNYIKLARELFIDINKNAKQVSHTRQILLDDIELFMFLTRNSIKQFNITDNEEFIQWKETNGYKYLERIPQAVVNWNSDLEMRDQDNIKQFKLAQITSTSLLYKIIKDFIFFPQKDQEKNNIFQTLFRILELDQFIPEEDSEDEKFFTELKRKAELFKTKVEDINNEINDAREEDQEDNDLLIEQYQKRITVANENALSFEPKLNNWITKRFYNNSKAGIYLTRFFSQFRPYQNRLFRTISHLGIIFR